MVSPAAVPDTPLDVGSPAAGLPEAPAALGPMATGGPMAGPLAKGADSPALPVPPVGPEAAGNAEDEEPVAPEEPIEPVEVGEAAGSSSDPLQPTDPRVHTTAASTRRPWRMHPRRRLARGFNTAGTLLPRLQTTLARRSVRAERLRGHSGGNARFRWVNRYQMQKKNAGEIKR